MSTRDKSRCGNDWMTRPKVKSIGIERIVKHKLGAELGKSQKCVPAS